LAANRNAFMLGRLAVHSPDAIAQALGESSGATARPTLAAMSLEALLADRIERLQAYQGDDLAARYAALVRLADEAEARAGMAGNALARCVASAFHRLLAVKDEYEVARLYGDGEFKAELDRRFEPGYVLRYHLAPPLIAHLDPATGRPRKQRFGPWLGPFWPWLARLRVLRGSWLDPFGHTRERRLERQLAEDYEATLRRLLPRLTAANHALLLEYAALPERIRGYGVVKLRNAEAAQAQAARILAQLGAASD
ncbi:MAG: DUF6537 domain-containing protein, partial [Ramlibacter sp.]